MTQEQIEAVRADLQKVVTGNPASYIGTVSEDALTALDHLTTRLAEVERERDEAATKAWEQARELVRGTNADMCQSAKNAYRLIIDKLTDAIHRPELRTLDGRVKHCLEDRTRMQELEAEVARLKVDKAFLAENRNAWCRDLDQTKADLTQARADLATLRAAIAEAVRRSEALTQRSILFAVAVAIETITEPLRNLDQPEADPLAQIFTDWPTLPGSGCEQTPERKAKILRTAIAARGGRVVFDKAEEPL